jgi:hypothetical protein
MRAATLVCSFSMAVAIFLTTVIFLPTDFLTEKYQERVEEERIISKTVYEGYSKYLDSFYYTLGSFEIPLFAFLLWFFWIRKVQHLFPLWMISIGWLLAAVLAMASARVWL